VGDAEAPSDEIERVAMKWLGRPIRYRRRQRMMQAMLRAGGAVARHHPWLRRMALRAGDRMIMACALGGPVPLFERDATGAGDLPVTVLVRSGPQTDRYVLYESDDPAATDRASFRALELIAEPLYGGGIQVFRTDNREHDRAYFVRAFAGNRSHDSDIMAAPVHSGSGESGASSRTPTLDWGAIGEPHWVSFLVLRRRDGQLDVGQRQRGAPPPTLPRDSEALYFAVQRDGWNSAFARLPLP
jgi:hypothetical protein